MNSFFFSRECLRRAIFLLFDHKIHVILRISSKGLSVCSAFTNQNLILFFKNVSKYTFCTFIHRRLYTDTLTHRCDRIPQHVCVSFVNVVRLCLFSVQTHAYKTCVCVKIVFICLLHKLVNVQTRKKKCVIRAEKSF